jgi:hypothetical protein
VLAAKLDHGLTVNGELKWQNILKIVPIGAFTAPVWFKTAAAWSG